LSSRFSKWGRAPARVCQTLTDDALARQLRLHLHRGIGYLAAPKTITTISELIQLAAEEPGRR
jgi:hypothetical protein